MIGTVVARVLVRAVLTVVVTVADEYDWNAVAVVAREEAAKARARGRIAIA